MVARHQLNFKSIKLILGWLDNHGLCDVWLSLLDVTENQKQATAALYLLDRKTIWQLLREGNSFRHCALRGKSVVVYCCIFAHHVWLKDWMTLPSDQFWPYKISVSLIQKCNTQSSYSLILFWVHISKDWKIFTTWQERCLCCALMQENKSITFL